MEKVGLAACSTLTLGCACRWGAACAGACTGGGTRGPCDCRRSSSSSSLRSTESIMPRRDDDVDVPVAGRLFRAAVLSFCGGEGGPAAGAAGGVAAPSGPSGSSTASSFVDWVPYCRRRGPRPAGERGAADTLGAELAAASLGVGEGVLDSSLSCLGASCADCEGTSATRSAWNRGARPRTAPYHPTGNHH